MRPVNIPLPPELTSSGKKKRPDVFKSGMKLGKDLRVVEHLAGSKVVDVYLCRHFKMSDYVVVKLLGKKLRKDADAARALMREGEILNKLRHPNIVEGYGGSLEPIPHIIMQHLGGQTLETIFFKGNYRAFRVQDFVAVALDICDALTYLHSQGYVHLDVKPSNAMWHHGRTTLFDLSVARPFDPDKPLRTMAGTRDYKAPEQTDRKEAGYYTDVFGVGAVLYKLLGVGALPYPATRELEAKEGAKPEKVLDYSNPPVPLHDLNPGLVPTELNDIVLKAIAVLPEDRYPDPAALKRALEEWMKKAGIDRSSA